MYRLLAICVLVLWVAAMTALFSRDVWPAWTAQDAPALSVQQFRKADEHQQYGIYRSGKRIGTAFGSLLTTGTSSIMEGTISLHALAMLPEICIESTTDFEPDGTLDGFRLRVYGIPHTTILVRGERHGAYFPCELQIGPLFRQANLELSASRMIGETLRPFSFLPTLKVGQSWRMQLLDPVAAVLRRRAEFKSIIARVTDKESITSPLSGESVECFVVETLPRQVKAWVDAEGRILVQDVDVPGFGKLSLREEKYDGPARTKLRQRFIGRAASGEAD